MQTQLVQLIEKKLAEELRKIDSITLEAVDTACNGIGPAPTCPHVSDVMEAINHACGRGHVERAKVAREVIVSTISPIKDILTPKAADQIMAVITKAFPEDWFLSVAQNIRDVYKGGSVPTNKFHERAFEVEFSAMRVGAINASRQAIEGVKTALDEILLQAANTKHFAKLLAPYRKMNFMKKLAFWSSIATIAGFFVAIFPHDVSSQNQTSHGNQSPNISNTQGDVNINYGSPARRAQ